jgi:hypothetical protein
MLAEDANKLDGLNTCIIGTTSDGYLVYCYEKLVQFHIDEHHMSSEEAVEWVDYNILGLGGEGVNWTIAMPQYYEEIDGLTDCG